MLVANGCAASFLSKVTMVCTEFINIFSKFFVVVFLATVDSLMINLQMVVNL